MKKAAFSLIIPVFLVTVSLIAVLIWRPGIFARDQKAAEPRQSRMVIPRFEDSEQNGEEAEKGIAVFEDSMNAKVALDAGELLVSVLTQDIDGDPMDEQILAYRNLSEPESPVYLSYVVFDRGINGYKRIWDTPTVVTQPGTVSLYTQDVTGDHSLCVILTGMNSDEARSMTIFKKNAEAGEKGLFSKIAEIEIDGSIQIQETERSQAYRMGFSDGKSFTIAAYGRDPDSENILDQIEIIYSYNSGTGFFEQENFNRIPGSQIEYRRVREILSGGSKAFENFISGLWYYVSPQGTLDTRQYIYFDPQNRELIFYNDDVQVFSWQNSSATRYGIYIASQNISVTTLRRSIDIELESLNSIRVKIFEDVRLKIGVSDSWQGSYRKAEPRRDEDIRGNAALPASPFAAAPDDASGEDKPEPYVSCMDAVYDGITGKFVFSKSGEYELYKGNASRKGNYAFFTLDNRILLELRPGVITGLPRETYLVDGESGESNPPAPWETLTLTRIRLSTRGFQEVHEAVISLSLVTES
jgi:hypothetical protein